MPVCIKNDLTRQSPLRYRVLLSKKRRKIIMKKRVLAALLVSAMVVATVVGCGSKSSSDDSSKKETTEASDKKDSDETVTVVTAGTGEDVYKRQLVEYPWYVYSWICSSSCRWMPASSVNPCRTGIF